MRGQSIFLVGCLLVLPALGQAEDFKALLDQVPGPPVSMAAAMARYQEGHSENGSQTGFDKSAVKLLALIDRSEKSSGMSGTKVGGESAQDIKDKMANMSQDEKLAYAMKLASKMQADQKSAYTGADSRSMMQVAQSNAASVQKSMAVEDASKAMSDADADFQAQFDALLNGMLGKVKACPQKTVGEASGPDPACVKPVLAKYKSDYQELATKKMAKYAAIFADFKKKASAEIAGWQKDIATLSSASTDTAGNEVTRKKMMIYEDIKDLCVPANKMVELGHDAASLDPMKVCGGNCLQD